jgi:hypothetical protein
MDLFWIALVLLLLALTRGLIALCDARGGER